MEIPYQRTCRICKKIIKGHIVNPDLGRKAIFFDENWNPLIGRSCYECQFLPKIKTIVTKHCLGCSQPLINNRYTLCASCIDTNKKQKKLLLIKPKLKNKCPICTNDFWGYGHNKYCGVKCARKQHYKTQKKHTKTKACHVCSKDIPVRRKYCIPCKPKRKTKYKYTYKKKPLSVIYCRICKNTFMGRTNYKFCSKKCERKSNKHIYKAIKKRRELKYKQAALGIPNKYFSSLEKNKPDGYDIDHIVPLNGKNVCGLHVPWNMRYVKSSLNNFKSNKFDGTYENRSWMKELLK